MNHCGVLPRGLRFAAVSASSSYSILLVIRHHGEYIILAKLPDNRSSVFHRLHPFSAILMDGTLNEYVYGGII